MKKRSDPVPAPHGPQAEYRTPSGATIPVPTFVAQYKPALLPEHRGNPLIEALPQILSGWDLQEGLRRHPKITRRERNLPAPHRRLAVGALRAFIEPLPDQFPVIDHVLQMLLDGYEARNPCDPAFQRSVNASYHSQPGQKPQPLVRMPPATAPSGTLLGISGLGKTTSIERVLSFLPQVLIHPEHNLHQIVHMKLECPSDGSVKSLMLNFVGTIDRLLDTDYSSSCNRITNGPLVQLAGKAARRHHIGLLVLDEAQSLLKAKRDDETHMIRFFVMLANVLRIPILLLGTVHAKQALSSTLHLSRRAGDSFVWEPMAFDGEDGEWHHFMTKLFSHQWTRRQQPLTLELSKTFHDETMGITGLAVRLHALCQLHLISDDEEDEVDAELIRALAGARFSLMRPLLDALRAGRAGVDLPDVGAAFKQIDEAISKRAMLSGNPDGKAVADLRTMGFERDRAEGMVNAVPADKRGTTVKQVVAAALGGKAKGAARRRGRSLMDVSPEGKGDAAFAAELRGVVTQKGK